MVISVDAEAVRPERNDMFKIAAGGGVAGF